MHTTSRGTAPRFSAPSDTGSAPFTSTTCSAVGYLPKMYHNAIPVVSVLTYYHTTATVAIPKIKHSFNAEAHYKRGYQRLNM